MDKLIKDREELQAVPGGICSECFRGIVDNSNKRHILSDLVDKAHLREMKEYQAKLAKGYKGKEPKKSTTRSNVKAGQMTIKTLIDLLKNVLNVELAEFTIRVKFHNDEDWVSYTALRRLNTLTSLTDHMEPDDLIEEFHKLKDPVKKINPVKPITKIDKLQDNDTVNRKETIEKVEDE